MRKMSRASLLEREGEGPVELGKKFGGTRERC